MYRNLGMDLAACAKFLHVTERTLHNWESGKHDIPFAAYKLLRLMNRMELPGRSWAGWCFLGGKLVSPEGRVFIGTDSSWWSLLIRRARMNDRAANIACADVGLRAQRGTAAAHAELASVDVIEKPRYSADAPASAVLYSAQQTPQKFSAISAYQLGQAGVVAPPDSLMDETAQRYSVACKAPACKGLQPIGGR